MALSQMPCPLLLLCSLLMLPSVLLQDVGVPGGVSPVPVTDKGVQAAAAFAVEKYNERSSNPNYFKQLRVVKAQSQVVSGAKYFLTVDIVKTECEKSNGALAFSDIQNCKSVSEKLTCSFVVWSRPWLKENELVGMSCF